MSTLTEVVILTGNASLDTAVKALREHIFDYLMKPVQPGRLIETMDRAGERWRRKSAENALGESEERLRRMFQAIADAVFITDSAGTIVDANDAAVVMSGHRKDAIVEMMLGELVHRADGEHTGRPMRTAPGSSVAALGQHVLLTSGGQELVVEVRTAEFSPDRYVHTVRDQTERHRLEEQLRRAQRMEAVGQVAGGLAHDFNNVLTAITGYAELLSWDVAKGSASAEHVAEILEAANRAGRLTKELLTFSRRQVFVPKILDLNSVVSGLRPMLRRLVREDIELSFRFGPNLGSVRGDKGRLEQALVNLVVNAGDAMPNGGALTLTTSQVAVDAVSAEEIAYGMQPGEYVALAVADTGIGMVAETLEKIFEPFFTTKEPGRGTGLGLATTYGIVKQSEGHIHVKSEPARGTCFTIYLPSRDEIPEDPSEETTAAISPTGKETILLAEDDPTVRTFVKRALELHGYTVLSADHPEAALGVARTHQGTIHLLFTDVVMPGIGGPALARELRKIHPKARVILATGYHREPGLANAAAFDGFLEKPFRMEGLLQEVRRVLDLKA